VHYSAGPILDGFYFPREIENKMKEKEVEPEASLEKLLNNQNWYLDPNH